MKSHEDSIFDSEPPASFVALLFEKIAGAPGYPFGTLLGFFSPWSIIRVNIKTRAVIEKGRSPNFLDRVEVTMMLWWPFRCI